jgi:hypothetical protein
MAGGYHYPNQNNRSTGLLGARFFVYSCLWVLNPQKLQFWGLAMGKAAGARLSTRFLEPLGKGVLTK